MAATWVLKFPQVDLPKQPFLIHVTQKKGLDLDLLATDGEVAYRGKVRERNLAKLKANNYGGTDDEWTSILRFSLLSKQNSGISEAQRDSLEVQCAVSGKGSKATLSITFRTRIEDITSRLGTIELAYTDDTDDVDLFGWVASVIDQRDELRAQAMHDKINQDTMQSTIESLQQELKDLVEAKSEYESQLLSKFAILLNEKKEKIRNQQRILSSAKVDSRKLEELRLTIEGEQKHGMVNSKKRKGKPTKSSVDHDDDSDGFDVMDLDIPRTANDQSIESDEDSQGAATATESEDEVDAVDATDEPMKGLSKPVTSKKSSPPPPPRTLPFQKRDDKPKAKNRSTAEELPAPKGNANTTDKDDETASEDDEL